MGIEDLDPDEWNIAQWRRESARKDKKREERLARQWAARPCPGPGCGKPLGPNAATGRPKTWCSEKCRRAGARARKRAQAEKLRQAADLEPRTCPRDGKPIPPAGRGRPKTWCSDECRRAAYNERKAAEAGAIAIELVDRTHVVERIVEQRIEIPGPEHDLDECVTRVLASPGACRRILNTLATTASHDGLTDARWAPVADAAHGVVRALDNAADARRIRARYGR